MRNPNNSGSEEEWEMLSDDWTEANAEEQSEAEAGEDDADVAHNDAVERHEEATTTPNKTEEEEEKEVVLKEDLSEVQEDDDIVSFDETQLLLEHENESEAEEPESKDHEETTTTPNTTKEEEEIAFEEDLSEVQEDDIMSSFDEHELLLENENQSEAEPESKDDENEPESSNAEPESKDEEEVEEEEELTPGVQALVDMGFLVKDAKEALFYSDGDMNQAVSDLVGEQKEWHKMNRARKDAMLEMKHAALEVVDSLHLKDAAKVVGKAVEKGATHVAKAVRDQNVPAKARVAAHKAKLTARTVGREVQIFNDKFRVTDTLATVGMVVAAAMLAKGNVRVATTTAAVAGSAYVAGEGMRNRPREEIFE